MSPRISARDYKKAQRRVTELGRWREFGLGLLVGAAVAAGIFIYTQGSASAPMEAPKPEPRKSTPPAEVTAERDESGEQYDFYEMLPNFEVVVPERDREVKRDLPTASVRPGVYILQAGSYRNLTDAERVRAQLALQGIDANVQRVALDNDVWHRLRIGPISNGGELNRIRKQLQAAEIDALLIRVGD